MSSKDEKKDSNRTIEPESPPTKAEGKARRGAPRGKPSWRAKDEKFREKVGGRVKKEIRSDIDRRTHSDIDEIISQLTRLCVDAVPLTVQLPLTTRALGLLVNLSFDAARVQLRSPPPLTKNQFYRVTLAQFHLQLIRSAIERKGSYVGGDEVLAQLMSAPFFEFEHLVVSHPATLKAISSVINSAGFVEHQGVKYSPVVPVPHLWKREVTVERPSDEPGVLSDAPPIKRMRTTESRVGPDPFVVTFSNLRSTVEALNNVGTPLDIRQFFRRYSTIPDMVWSDDDVLMNPDDIMPPVYTAGQLYGDCCAVKAFCERLSGKNQYLLGTCGYTGKGSPSQLTSATVTVSSDYVTTDFVGSPYDIPTNYLIVGALSLFGENPPYPSQEFSYAIRKPSSCGKLLDVDWQQVLTTLHTRI